MSKVKVDHVAVDVEMPNPRQGAAYSCCSKCDASIATKKVATDELNASSTFDGGTRVVIEVKKRSSLVTIKFLYKPKCKRRVEKEKSSAHIGIFACFALLKNR